MREALEIMHRLLEGEKLDFSGDWYTTDKARLYSPPPRKTPIWMAAGGPQSSGWSVGRPGGQCSVSPVRRSDSRLAAADGAARYVEDAWTGQHRAAKDASVRMRSGLSPAVKAPADTMERVIGPFRAAAEEFGRAGTVMTTRWCVLAGDSDEASTGPLPL